MRWIRRWLPQVLQAPLPLVGVLFVLGHGLHGAPEDEIPFAGVWPSLAAWIDGRVVLFALAAWAGGRLLERIDPWEG